MLPKTQICISSNESLIRQIIALFSQFKSALSTQLLTPSRHHRKLHFWSKRGCEPLAELYCSFSICRHVNWHLSVFCLKSCRKPSDLQTRLRGERYCNFPGWSKLINYTRNFLSKYFLEKNFFYYEKFHFCFLKLNFFRKIKLNHLMKEQ